jgi:hypothetical protein
LYMYKDVKLEVLRRILLASVFESRWGLNLFIF